MDIDTGQIAFFCFANRRVMNDIGNSKINRILLVVVQFLVGTQKGIGLQNPDFSHAAAPV